jgi:hypothetical protein
MSDRIAAVLDRIEAQRDEQTIPDNIPLIELADMVVRGKVKLSPPQQRMLIEMLPFVAPKLTAVAYMREVRSLCDWNAASSEATGRS